MDTQGKRRHSRKNKANSNADSNADRIPCRSVFTAHVDNFRHNRRKRGAKQRYVNITPERFPAESCIKKTAKDDRENIPDILAKQRETRHQKKGGDADAGKGHTQQTQKSDTDQCYKPRIDKRGPHASDCNRVSDQAGLRADNPPNTTHNSSGRIPKEAEYNQRYGEH